MREGDTIKIKIEGGYILRCKVLIPLDAQVPGQALVKYPQTGANVWVHEHEIVKGRIMTREELGIPMPSANKPK